MNELPPFRREQPWRQLALDGDAAAPARCDRTRDRVTVDLRGIGARLHAYCAARGMGVSAVVRSAVLTILDAVPSAQQAPDAAAPTNGPVVKLSVRLGARHAAQLGERASAAAVSRGVYIAGLLDATPPSPRSPDHREAVAALVHSTQRLAALSVDLNASIRLARSAGLGAELSVALTSLSEDVRLHLRTASRLGAELTAPARVYSGRRSVSDKGDISP